MPEISKPKENVIDSQVSGFYYDEQLKNKYLRVSLHPNTELVNGEWKMCTEDVLTGMSDDKWSNAYKKEPIAISILSEDFQFEINNSWTDFDGGNPIENIWNSAKPYAPLVGRLAEGLKGAVESMGDYNKDSWAGKVTQFADWSSKNLTTGSEYLNKALIIQGTRFSYYSGTSTSFGNLMMRYTIFSDWNTDKRLDPTREEDEFITVNDQINKIYPYTMGIYEPMKGGLMGKKGGDLDKTLEEYIGWQSPPGGFLAGTKNLDNCLQGTLRLMIGGYYSIENLVVRNMSVVMSKTMAKNPAHVGELTPLYADVTILLAPASSFTDKALMRFTNNSGMEEVIKDQVNKNKQLLNTAAQKAEK